MIFTTNAFRRAAAGAALVLSALAVPATTAQAATPPAATATASAVLGPYSDLRWCAPLMNTYKGSYCFLRNGRWYLYVP
ncbi:hypothetical protein AB0O28_12785 [Microbispora sp. NPDC088329]|uniref:hypothetical protein n=1 Tax=Microbispora sp. NPDC088329 TaxID=3154869 RepID=UPI003435285F